MTILGIGNTFGNELVMASAFETIHRLMQHTTDVDRSHTHTRWHSENYLKENDGLSYLLWKYHIANILHLCTLRLLLQLPYSVIAAWKQPLMG